MRVDNSRMAQGLMAALLLVGCAGPGGGGNYYPPVFQDAFIADDSAAADTTATDTTAADTTAADAFVGTPDATPPPPPTPDAGPPPTPDAGPPPDDGGCAVNACGECGPTPTEVCDDLDNDCDGDTDEGLECSGVLIFSEYLEGDSFDKALEITNVGVQSVDLQTVEVWGLTNIAEAGLTWAEAEAFTVTDATSSGLLPPGESIVICHSQMSDTGSCDALNIWLANFNGDDARALVVDGIIVDVIGAPSPLPTDGVWMVGPDGASTRDSRLIRKCAVTSGNTDWTASASSEWETSAPNDLTETLGSHSFGCP